MEFTVLKFCESEHHRDDLDFKLCRFCCKAMCNICFDTHKNHCSGQTESTKRNAHDTSTTPTGSHIKKQKTDEHLGQSGSSNSYSSLLCRSSPLTAQPPPKYGSIHAYPNCSVHSLLKDQFCITHCKLVCENCHIEHHAICTVKHVTNVCESLDHNSVTEYKKWLNNLRVSVIQIKTLLDRNLESVEKYKIAALKDLQTSFSKANESLNHAFLVAKSEIEKTFDCHSAENWENIYLIERMNDNLDNSLKDCRLLEGNTMDEKLFLKLVDIISKYNNQVLLAELKTLTEKLGKLKYSFVPNIRYQPLSPRSYLGRVNTNVTKLTLVNTASTVDLSHIFTNVLDSKRACTRANTEKDKLQKADKNSTTKNSGKSTESAHFMQKSESFERGKIKKDFIAKATGQFAFKYIDRNQNVQNIVLVPCKTPERERYSVSPSNGNKVDGRQAAKRNVLSSSNADAGSDVILHNLRKQLIQPGNTNKVDGIMQQPHEQSDSQTRSCIQVNAQNRTSIEKSHENASSCELEPWVSKPQTNEHTNLLQSIGSSSNADNSRQYGNTALSDKVNIKTGTLARIDKVTAGSTEEDHHVCMTPTSLHRIHSSSISNSMITSGEIFPNHNGQEYEDMTSNKTDVLIKPYIEVPQTSTEILKTSEYITLPVLLDKTTIASQSLQSIEIGTSRAHKNDAFSNSADTNKGFSTSDQGSYGTQYVDNNYIRQHVEGAEPLTSNTKGVEHCKQSFPCRTHLNSKALGQLDRSKYPNLNNVVMSTEIAQPLTRIKQQDNGCNSNIQALIKVSHSIANSSYPYENGNAMGLWQKIYANNNVGDMTGGLSSTLCETDGTTDITSNYNPQLYEGSKVSTLSTKDVDVCQNSSSIRSDSYIQPLDLSSDQYSYVNDVVISNHETKHTSNLPGSSSTPTEIENNTKATASLSHAAEIENNKKLVFTELNIKSVNKKNIRMSSDQFPPSITGCVFMPDERVVLCDFTNGKLKQLDRSFTLQDSLDLPSDPCDISVVNDTTVIITLPCKIQLQYIEVTPKLKLGRVLQLDKRCWGVNVVGSDIYVTCNSDYPGGDGEVRILDNNGKLKNRLGVNQDKTFMFTLPNKIAVSALSNKIYVSDREQDTVTCLRSDGTVIYQYKDPALRYPGGLCVDDEDNVIVCGGSSHNIHIVPAAGEKRSVILTSNYGVTYPQCVAYRRMDHTLIVGCYYNDNLFVIDCVDK